MNADKRAGSAFPPPLRGRDRERGQLNNPPPVVEYEHGITCVDTLQQRPGLAACYLLIAGDAAAFIECGTNHNVPRLLALLDARGITRERVAYVMPTHVHLDHAGGAGLLMSRLPNAKLVIHPRGARHMRDPSKLAAGAAAVYGADGLREMYGEPLPVPEDRMLIADDGFTLDLNGRALKFLDAPGHARHHYCIWDAASRGFFTGDIFGISYRDLDGPDGAYIFPTTTPVQFDPDAWNATLDRLLAFAPTRMYLTHFGMVEEVPRLAEDLRRGLAAYVRIAKSLSAADDRHARLVEALGTHHLHELDARKGMPPASRCRELLSFDMDLNAQGLEVWLDH